MASRIYKLLSLLAIASTIFIVSFAIDMAGGIEAAANLIPFRCPLNFLFEISCPTCGLGRSIVAAFAGDWNVAMGYHPLGLPLVFISLALAISSCSRSSFTLIKLKQILSFLRKHREMCYILVAFYISWGFFLRRP
jgi:hypothetical protein